MGPLRCRPSVVHLMLLVQAGARVDGSATGARRQEALSQSLPRYRSARDYLVATQVQQALPLARRAGRRLQALDGEGQHDAGKKGDSCSLVGQSLQLVLRSAAAASLASPALPAER